MLLKKGKTGVWITKECLMAALFCPSVAKAFGNWEKLFIFSSKSTKFWPNFDVCKNANDMLHLLNNQRITRYLI